MSTTLSNTTIEVELDPDALVNLILANHGQLDIHDFAAAGVSPEQFEVVAFEQTKVHRESRGPWAVKVRLQHSNPATEV